MKEEQLHSGHSGFLRGLGQTVPPLSGPGAVAARQHEAEGALKWSLVPSCTSSMLLDCVV